MLFDEEQFKSMRFGLALTLLISASILLGLRFAERCFYALDAEAA